MFWIIIAFIVGLVVGWSVTAPTWVKGLITKAVTWVVSKFKKTSS